MARRRTGDLRSTGAKLEVIPLVAPSGHFVFSPRASNLSDGLTHTDGQLTADAAARGFKTIAQVADGPQQARELEEGLKLSFGQKKGAAVPDRLMPKAVIAMRAVHKTNAAKTAFGQDPKAAKTPPEAKESKG